MVWQFFFFAFSLIIFAASWLTDEHDNIATRFFFSALFLCLSLLRSRQERIEIEAHIIPYVFASHWHCSSPCAHTEWQQWPQQWHTKKIDRMCVTLLALCCRFYVAISFYYQCSSERSIEWPFSYRLHFRILFLFIQAFIFGLVFINIVFSDQFPCDSHFCFASNAELSIALNAAHALCLRTMSAHCKWARDGHQ